MWFLVLYFQALELGYIVDFLEMAYSALSQLPKNICSTKKSFVNPGETNMDSVMSS